MNASITRRVAVLVAGASVSASTLTATSVVSGALGLGPSQATAATVRTRSGAVSPDRTPISLERAASALAVYGGVVVLPPGELKRAAAALAVYGGVDIPARGR